MKPLFLLFAFACCVTLLSVEALNPIVFFPGYSLSKLNVQVQGGNLPGCPSSGSFVASFGMTIPQNGFNATCMWKYMDILNYPVGRSGQLRFRNRDDVTITMPGRENGDATQCVGSDAYSSMFDFFRGKGYVLGGNQATFRAACWDWRIDPSNDVISGPSFVQNTINVVKSAYNSAGRQKVYLMAHSNGPMMTLHFLNSVTQEFKNKYIAGFIPLSGNFAGQGLFIAVFLQGFLVSDFSFSKETVDVQQRWTQNYFSLPQPEVFSGSNNEIVLEVVSPSSTFEVSSSSFDRFFRATGNDFGLQHWRDYIGLIGPSTPPFVPTWAFWGDGLDTAVGIKIDSFSANNIVDFFLKPGDTNQEHVTNASPDAWLTSMKPGCYHGYPQYGVTHFDLPVNQTVLNQIWGIISGPVPTIDCSPLNSEDDE